MDKLIVIFRKFKDEGDVIAIFPEILGGSNPTSMLSYQHVGQHGACSWDIMNITDLATPEEYADLIEEIKQIYDDCEIVIRKRMQYKYYQTRVAEWRRIRGLDVQPYHFKGWVIVGRKDNKIEQIID